jgi:hypothetical protein
MKHSTGEILQSSKLEDILPSMPSMVQEGVVMAEHMPQSLEGAGWDELEDDVTTSRRAVVVQPVKTRNTLPV